jgi:translation initiation factor IF-3
MVFGIVGRPAVFCVWLRVPLRYPYFHFNVRRCFRISNMAHQINEEIRDKEVRLISPTGEQLGILPIEQALDKAAELDLDLVKISPNAVPPVCKLMNYGKFRFEQTKREKEAKKNQHVVEIKEVRMSPRLT